MHQILVIEDEPGIRAVLRVLLEAEKYRVIEAGSAGRGEIEARSHKPDLVLIDLGLPDEDGVAVIRRLREWSPIPIVVLSARTMESQKVAALDAGADDYVTKPFGATELPRVRRATQVDPRHGVAARTGTGRDADRPRTPQRSRGGRGDPPDPARVPRARMPRAAGWNDRHVPAAAARGVGSRPCGGHRRAARVHQGIATSSADPRRPRFLVTEAGIGYQLRAGDAEDA
jgi:two-component system KDP operon response regulator KdpE